MQLRAVLLLLLLLHVFSSKGMCWVISVHGYCTRALWRVVYAHTAQRQQRQESTVATYQQM
jgi:hypothetical protein